ncbi:hypothetical protein VTO73DRAFT_7663 [Trametes versicolor]
MVAQKEDVAAMLYECIKKMTHLEVLIFDVNLDALLDCHPRYAAAFSDLRTIKRLKVAAGGPGCFAMLKNMRSQLVSVELQMWHATTTRDLTLEQDLNPVTLLEHSSGTLERLECERWYPIQFHSGNPHYPAMRRLTLDNESVPSRAALVQAYPNLTHLYFHWVDFEIPVDEDSWEVMLSEAFEASSATPFSLSWTELEEVRGTTGIIWALALRCRVRRLDLNTVRNHGDRVMLSSLLRRTHPTHLGLATAGAFFDEEIQDSMQEIFSQEGASGLRSLDLWLDFDPDDLLDIPEYMEYVQYTVTQLQLEELSLHISGTHFAEYDRDDPNIVRPFGASGVYLRDLDLRALANAFMDGMHTLKKMRAKVSSTVRIEIPVELNDILITRTSAEAERRVVMGKKDRGS